MLLEGKRLMEMDLAKVEIRWGNCEKMAGVLASGGSGCSAKRDGAEKKIKLETSNFRIKDGTLALRVGEMFSCH